MASGIHIIDGTAGSRYLPASLNKMTFEEAIMSESLFTDSPSNEQVEYRNIPDYPGYRVGSDGTVWSCWKLNWLGRYGSVGYQSTEWKELKLRKNHNGYLRIGLYRDGIKRQKYFFVHRLVLEAFVGPCPEGMQVCHFPDPTPTNCRLENLRWGTLKENCEDRRKHGNAPIGEANPYARLTEQQIREIRKKYQKGVSGKSCRALGKEYGVSDVTISNIMTGKRWGHVK